MCGSRSTGPCDDPIGKPKPLMENPTCLPHVGVRVIDQETGFRQERFLLDNFPLIVLALPLLLPASALPKCLATVGPELRRLRRQGQRRLKGGRFLLRSPKGTDVSASLFLSRFCPGVEVGVSSRLSPERPPRCHPLNDSQSAALSWEHRLCAGPREVPMNMSDMTRRVTEALKQMTDRLTHRKNAQPQQPSSKDNAFDNRMRNERGDVT
jgi:hypothetical protein